jgi:hypothetical protein
MPPEYVPPACPIHPAGVRSRRMSIPGITIIVIMMLVCLLQVVQLSKGA